MGLGGDPHRPRQRTGGDRHVQVRKGSRSRPRNTGRPRVEQLASRISTRLHQSCSDDAPDMSQTIGGVRSVAIGLGVYPQVTAPAAQPAGVPQGFTRIFNRRPHDRRAAGTSSRTVHHGTTAVAEVEDGVLTLEPHPVRPGWPVPHRSRATRISSSTSRPIPTPATTAASSCAPPKADPRIRFELVSARQHRRAARPSRCA